MNKERRKKLSTVYDALTECMNTVEAVKDEERESLDNLPDSFRNSERGEDMENYIELLNESYNLIDDAHSVVEQI